MKKLLFVCAVIAVAFLASCSNEPQVERVNLVDNVFAEKIVADNGAISYRVVYEMNKRYLSCTSDTLTFDKVEYDKAIGLVKAYKGDKLFFFKGTSIFGSDEGFVKIEPYQEGFNLISANSDVSLYMPETGYIFGPYKEIKKVGKLLFVRGPIGWGLLDTDFNYLEDRRFDKLYIINQNAEEYDVLKQKDGEWSMTTSKGATYDDESVKDAVKLLKKKNVADSIGIF